MRYILFLLIMISITACESKEEIAKAQEAESFKQEQLTKVKESANFKVRVKEETLTPPQPVKKEVSILEANNTQENNGSIINNLGFSMDDGMLIIDTKKAKAFFGILAQNLTSVDEELKEGNLTIAKPMGIEVNETTIHIDINKLSKKMEQFVREFDTFTKTLHSDNNTTKE